MIFPNFPNRESCEKYFMKDNKHNRLHLARKYARIFVLGHYLFLIVHRFVRFSEFEQIMSADKYPSICPLRMETIVYIARLITPTFPRYQIWRREGGMVASWLVRSVSGSSGLGSSPGRGHCVVFLDKAHYSRSASLLTTQVYKWVLENLMLGVTL